MSPNFNIGGKKPKRDYLYNAPTPRQYKSSLVCSVCGHSLDMHTDSGCRVEKLLERKPCDCTGFKRKIT